MFGGYFGLNELGAFLFWLFKRGRTKYSDCRDYKYNFLIGLLFILLLVIILGGRLF